MRNNIPAELRCLNQWVCASDDKAPRNPRTGELADVCRPETWGTFYEALHSGYKHIGFVLTKQDPYCIVDLDEPLTPQQQDRHNAIYTAFDATYAEVSQSGRGIHIVCRAVTPSGVRRDRCEVYTAERYMIFTGNVLRNCPITDYQGIVANMHAQMASTAVAELEDQPDLINDEKLYEIASTASNHEKFNRLWLGDMTGYPSQSEADFALMSMLAFYSQSNEQCRRMFRWSALGQRDKAQRNDKYLNFALGKIRGRQGQAVAQIDLSAFFAAHEAKQQGPAPLPAPLPVVIDPSVYAAPLPGIPESVYAEVKPHKPAPLQLGTSVYPPGLLGDVARYIYSSAYRQVNEIALCGAIAFMAGIAGRHYNISGTGLNHYVMVLAGTGTGKEDAQKGIDRLAFALRPHASIEEFMGPSAFASGQAVTRRLGEQPCFVSVLGEMGLLLKQWCGPDANAINVQIRRCLLDLYGKSGFSQSIKPSIYSDAEKNTTLVQAPCVTILGESTPETFYSALDASHVAEGLIPRFNIVEYEGGRVPGNPRASHPPDEQLIRALVAIVQSVQTMKVNGTCCHITIDKEARVLLDAFDRLADDKINSSENEMLTQLWNRAHLKALKLSGLVAVGVSCASPTVTAEVARWAINMVTCDVNNISSKFASGAVGGGELKGHHDLIKAVEKWKNLTPKQRKSANAPDTFINQDKLIPYAYFKHFLQQRVAFKDHKLGPAKAVQAALDEAVKVATLCVLPPAQAMAEMGTKAPVYYVD